MRAQKFSMGVVTPNFNRSCQVTTKRLGAGESFDNDTRQGKSRGTRRTLNKCGRL